MFVLMVAIIGSMHYCVKPLLTIYASLPILPFVNSTRGTEMNWTNLIPGIPLFICLAILAYGFWTAEEEE
jgi:ABC-type uncharacterized transport system permease subunit